jgi:hypothetical protein
MSWKVLKKEKNMHFRCIEITTHGDASSRKTKYVNIQTESEIESFELDLM